MGYILGWIGGSILVGFLGSSRRIGGITSFFISLIFSPVIGLIFTLISPTGEDEAFKKELLNVSKDLSMFKPRINEEEIEKKQSELKDLEILYEYLQKGIITEEEFNTKKSKILNLD